MNGGRRWLMTASYDKLNKFWDLNSPIEPIVCYKKHEITEGVWPCNWLGAATSQDDATITSKSSRKENKTIFLPKSS